MDSKNANLGQMITFVKHGKFFLNSFKTKTPLSELTNKRLQKNSINEHKKVILLLSQIDSTSSTASNLKAIKKLNDKKVVWPDLSTSGQN